MTAGLASFYDAFLDAVIDGRPRALGAYLDDRAAATNAVVYRNTVFRGAADALATAYPAVARLAGADYFESVAVAYATTHPPRQRSLVGYGESFPAFLESAPGIAEAPYIPDAARLDQAWLAAHRAAGGAPLEAAALRAIPPDRLAELKLRLHPSVQIVDLSWSIHDAWKDNRGDGAGQSAREVCKDRQAVLLWRLGYEVQSQVLSKAEAYFFAALRDGQTLGEAAAGAIQRGRDFNTSLVFAGALEAGVFDLVQPDLDTKREEWW